MVKSDLSKLFITRSEAAEFSSALAQISQQVYQTDFSLEKAITAHLGVEKKDLMMQLITEAEVDRQDNAALIKYFAGLQETVMKLPIISITLPFPVNTETLTKISDWLQLNTSSQVTVTFEMNRELLGGAIINFKGKFYDGSIRSKFMEAAYGSNV